MAFFNSEFFWTIQKIGVNASCRKIIQIVFFVEIMKRIYWWFFIFSTHRCSLRSTLIHAYKCIKCPLSNPTLNKLNESLLSTCTNFVICFAYRFRRSFFLILCVALAIKILDAINKLDK